MKLIMRWCGLLLLLCLSGGNALALESVAAFGTDSWWNESPWQNPDRGFNWYPDPREVEKKAEEKPEEKPPKTIYDMTTLEEIKKELDRLKSVAVVNPTNENVKDFLKAQNWVMDKSSLFADVARRVVWATPEVNYQARSSVATFALDKERSRRLQAQERALADLSQTHALLFFARSDCPACHDQSPVLKAFSKQSGIPVLAITLDGGPIPNFPDARPDNGISMLASSGEGVRTVPAIFLVSRDQKQIVPLSVGVVAGSDLAERIRVVMTTTPGEEF